MYFKKETVQSVKSQLSLTNIYGNEPLWSRIANTRCNSPADRLLVAMFNEEPRKKYYLSSRNECKRFIGNSGTRSFPVKNPIRAYAYETNWWTRVRGRGRKRGREREARAGCWGQCAAADLQPAWPKYAYESGIFFFLFIFVALDGRPISRFCSLSHHRGRALRRSLPGSRPFFFFVYVPTQRWAWEYSARVPVHLFLAFVKISHAGPVIARGVNYSRDANATPIVIDSIDRVVSLLLLPRCGLSAMSKYARNYPSLLSPFIICDWYPFVTDIFALVIIFSIFSRFSKVLRNRLNSNSITTYSQSKRESISFETEVENFIWAKAEFRILFL